jgi:hypothetical protein
MQFKSQRKMFIVSYILNHHHLHPFFIINMPKASKHFASQRARSITLSDNPETVRIREIRRSRIGFAMEEHRIKTKYCICLACSKQAMRSSSEWINASASDREFMEARCTKAMEDNKL